MERPAAGGKAHIRWEVEGLGDDLKELRPPHGRIDDEGVECPVEATDQDGDGPRLGRRRREGSRSGRRGRGRRRPVVDVEGVDIGDMGGRQAWRGRAGRKGRRHHGGRGLGGAGGCGPLLCAAIVASIAPPVLLGLGLGCWWAGPKGAGRVESGVRRG